MKQQGISSIQTGTVAIPAIGLGTYALRGNECVRAITDALEMGYRHIDTAQFYQNEAEVGNGIRQSSVDRNEVFVSSKIWPSDFARLEKATGESLKRLGLEQLDLLLLHWPAGEEANRKAVDMLYKMQQEGFARHIGVSNFSISQLEQALSQAPIVCNQVEYHPFIDQGKMLQYLKQHDLFLTAYSPLALGKVSRNRELKRIGEAYHKTSSQVALRWLVQQGSVSVIPKASTHERRKENLGIFDFSLSEAEMDMISQLNQVSH